jgi:chromosome segregation ATPase
MTPEQMAQGEAHAQAEIDRLVRLLDEVADREARVCPEGYTYEQYITTLQQEQADLEQAICTNVETMTVLADRAKDAEREATDWKERASTYYVQLNEAEATKRRVEHERDVADRSGRAFAEQARRLRAALERVAYLIDHPSMPPHDKLWHTGETARHALAGTEETTP